MKFTQQIGVSPFPIIMNFLTYATLREASARAPTKTKEAANK